MFKKWKQQRLIKRIKKRQELITKLKEELIKMGKLAIKDGKLIKQDDNTTPPQSDGFPQQLSQPIQQPQYQQPIQQPQYQQPIQQPQYQQSQYQQPQPMIQPIQQQIQQPQYRQPIQQPIIPEPSIIVLTLQTGQQLQIQVPNNVVDQFMSEVYNAINNKTSISIGNQLINGAYIVSINM